MSFFFSSSFFFLLRTYKTKNHTHSHASKCRKFKGTVAYSLITLSFCLILVVLFGTIAYVASMHAVYLPCQIHLLVIPVVVVDFATGGQCIPIPFHRILPIPRPPPAISLADPFHHFCLPTYCYAEMFICPGTSDIQMPLILCPFVSRRRRHVFLCWKWF